MTLCEIILNFLITFVVMATNARRLDSLNKIDYLKGRVSIKSTIFSYDRMICG